VEINKIISGIEILNCDPDQEIDLIALRQLSFEGIPSTITTDENDKYPCITSPLRAIVWRILLGVLPLKT
jgi:hypothetical protein